MKILLASAELAPFVSTGGLGDVVAGLAGALVRSGHDVTVAVPDYRLIATDPSRFRSQGVWRTLEREGLSIRLFRDEGFDRLGVYGPAPGTSYEDNWERFGRFCLAIAKLAPKYDVVHAHDAHTGPLALITGAPVVYTVHNASHQMLAPLADTAALLGLGPDATRLGGPLEWYGDASFLKAGMVGAARVTTVSPGHAAELAVDDSSFGLGGVVRSLEHPIVGIMNGIDTTTWNPETDQAIPANYSAKRLTARQESRAALLDRADVEDGMLVGNVGRMARQKGLDLLTPYINQLIEEGLRLVLVGNGELDHVVDGWVDDHKDAVAHLPYSEDLARLVSAGADAYLMPSRFEPSGLGQMYAMRYGCPPIVRLVGGLRDSVIDIDEDPAHGTGFGFRTYDAASLAKTIRRAMRLRASHMRMWKRLQINGMTTDFSWDARAVEYESVYRAVGSEPA